MDGRHKGAEGIKTEMEQGKRDGKEKHEWMKWKHDETNGTKGTTSERETKKLMSRINSEVDKQTGLE